MVNMPTLFMNYLIHVSVAKYKDGQFEELERHLTVPEDFNDDTKLAAVRLSHDQQTLYISKPWS